MDKNLIGYRYLLCYTQGFLSHTTWSMPAFTLCLSYCNPYRYVTIFTVLMWPGCGNKVYFYWFLYIVTKRIITVEEPPVVIFNMFYFQQWQNCGVFRRKFIAEGRDLPTGSPCFILVEWFFIFTRPKKKYLDAYFSP